MHGMSSVTDRFIFGPIAAFITRIRSIALPIILIAALALSVGGALNRNRPVRAFINGNRAFQTANLLSGTGKMEAARAYFKKAITEMEPVVEQRAFIDHQDVINCIIFTAMCYENLGEWNRAESLYRLILSEYPFSRYIGEAYVKIGRIRKHGRDRAMDSFLKNLGQGQVKAGLELLRVAFDQTIECLKYLDDAIQCEPHSRWAAYARKDASKEWRYIIEKERAIKSINYLAQPDKNRIESAWKEQSKKLKAFSMKSVFIQELQKTGLAK